MQGKPASRTPNACSHTDPWTTVHCHTTSTRRPLQALPSGTPHPATLNQTCLRESKMSLGLLLEFKAYFVDLLTNAMTVNISWEGSESVPHPAPKMWCHPSQPQLQKGGLALYREMPQVSLSSAPQASPSLAPMTPAMQLFSFK